MQKKRVLVTGGCGFIGTHVVKAFLRDGYSVHVVDDMTGADYETFIESIGVDHVRTLPVGVVSVWEYQREKQETADIVVFEGDFAEPPIISRIVNGKYDAVVHLAADPRVEYCIEYPVSTYQNNLQKTIELFYVCAKSSTRVVFASSAAVYGAAENIGPMLEDIKKNPRSTYGLQKLQAEQVGQMFTDLYDLSIMSLRFFNVYGPGQQGNSPYSTVIAAWIDKINNNEPLRLDGDGLQTRDYIHVSDISRACLLAAQSTKNDILNIASGKSKSNNEILNILSVHRDFKVKTAPDRIGDVRHSLADVKRASEILGFQAEINVSDGISDLLVGSSNAR